MGKNEGDDLEKSYESKSRKVKKMVVNEGKVDYDSHSSMDSDDEAFIPEYESDVLEDTVKEEYDSAPVSSSDSEDGDAGENAEKKTPKSAKKPTPKEKKA